MSDSEVCLICYDSDNNDDFFHPCLCKNGIHRSCLMEWIGKCNNTEQQKRCSVCKYQFKYEYEFKYENQISHYRRKEFANFLCSIMTIFCVFLMLCYSFSLQNIVFLVINQYFGFVNFDTTSILSYVVFSIFMSSLIELVGIFVKIHKNREFHTALQKSPCSIENPFFFSCLYIIVWNFGGLFNRGYLSDKQMYRTILFLCYILSPVQIFLIYNNLCVYKLYGNLPFSQKKIKDINEK
jgi:hypothetical protein